jgi:serine/threonine protein phosphatase PrpC
VGDSRGLLVREADCSREIIATRDHKPNDILERERIQASGGRIKYERGCYRLERLALSRGVGDYPRIRGYSTEVDITEYCISGLKYIILASDGIWDGLSNKEVVDYIYFYKNIGRSLEQITQGLINKVSDKNDDKTIMILYFNQ